MAKFLDTNGLTTLWEKIKTLVNTTLETVKASITAITDMVGAANGIAPLDSSKLVPTANIPTQYQDVLVFAGFCEVEASQILQGTIEKIQSGSYVYYNTATGTFVAYKNKVYYTKWTSGTYANSYDSPFYGTEKTYGVQPSFGKIYLLKTQGKAYQFVSTSKGLILLNSQDADIALLQSQIGNIANVYELDSLITEVSKNWLSKKGDDWTEVSISKYFNSSDGKLYVVHNCTSVIDSKTQETKDVWYYEVVTPSTTDLFIKDDAVWRYGSDGSLTQTGDSVVDILKSLISQCAQLDGNNTFNGNNTMNGSLSVITGDTENSLYGLFVEGVGFCLKDNTLATILSNDGTIILASSGGAQITLSATTEIFGQTTIYNDKSAKYAIFDVGDGYFQLGNGAGVQMVREVVSMVSPSNAAVELSDTARISAPSTTDDDGNDVSGAAVFLDDQGVHIENGDLGVGDNSVVLTDSAYNLTDEAVMGVSWINAFEVQSNVSLEAAHILDIDRTNKIATIRYTVQSNNEGNLGLYCGTTLMQVIVISNDNKGAFVICMPYDDAADPDNQWDTMFEIKAITEASSTSSDA